MALQLKFFLLFSAGFMGRAFGIVGGMDYLEFNCQGWNNFTRGPAKTGLRLGDICNAELTVGDPGPDFSPNFDRMVSADLKCVPLHSHYTAALTVAVGAEIDNAEVFDMTFDHPDLPDAQSAYCLLQVSVSTQIGTEVNKISSKPTRVFLYPALGNNAYVKITDYLPTPSTMPDAVMVEEGKLKTAINNAARDQISFEWGSLGKLTGIPLFTAVYLKKKSGKYITQWECNEFEGDMFNETFPRLATDDILINFTAIEVTNDDANSELLINWLPDDLTDVCGDYDLVFYADILDTVVEEENFCDNFYVIPVIFTGSCEGNPEPKPASCKAITNIFSPKSTLFVINGLKDYYDEEDYYMLKSARTYEMESGNKGGEWMESKYWDIYHHVRTHGYALLEVIWKYIVKKESDFCELVDLNIAKEELRAIDSDAATLATFPPVGDPDFVTAWDEFSSITDMQSLLTTFSGFGDIYTSPEPFNVRMSEMIRRETVRGFILNYDPTALPEEWEAEFSIQKMIGRLMWDDPSGITDEELLYYTSRLTSILVELKMGQTTTSCFEEQYDHLIMSIRNFQTSMPTTLTFEEYPLFDPESIEEFLFLQDAIEIPRWNASQLKVNSCIRRLDAYNKTVCHGMVDELSDPEIFKHICLIGKFRAFMQTNRKALGLTYIMKQLLIAQAKDAKENRKMMDFLDPLMIESGGFNPIVYMDGAFYQSTISPGYNKVCRKKIATCLCKMCMYDMGGYMGGSGGYMSGIDGYMGGSSGYMGGSGGYMGGSGSYMSGMSGSMSGDGGYMGGSGSYMSGMSGSMSGDGGYMGGSMSGSMSGMSGDMSGGTSMDMP